MRCFQRRARKLVKVNISKSIMIQPGAASVSALKLLSERKDLCSCLRSITRSCFDAVVAEAKRGETPLPFRLINGISADFGKCGGYHIAAPGSSFGGQLSGAINISLICGIAPGLGWEITDRRKFCGRTCW